VETGNGIASQPLLMEAKRFAKSVSHPDVSIQGFVMPYGILVKKKRKFLGRVICSPWRMRLAREEYILSRRADPQVLCKWTKANIQDVNIVVDSLPGNAWLKCNRRR
jgi:hypothetical protein